MATARELVRRFGGNPDDLRAEIGNQNGWGWADVVLASRLPAKCDGNPYEYAAYDMIRDDWLRVCLAVESDADGADAELHDMLARYANAMRGR